VKPKRDSNRSYGKGYEYTNVYSPSPGHIIHIVHINPSAQYQTTGQIKTYDFSSGGGKKIKKIRRYEGSNLGRS
jgi:hypothetical protein